MSKKLFPIIMILALISGCSNNKTVTKLPENTVKNIVSQKENNSLKNNKDETAELPNPESLIITDNIKETETEIKDEFISSDINEIFSEGTEKKESPVADVPIDESDTISENIIEPIPTPVPVIIPTKNPKSTPTPIVESEINPDYIPDPTPTPISTIPENINEDDNAEDKQEPVDTVNNTVKGVNLKTDFSKSEELQKLKSKFPKLILNENGVSAGFSDNPNAVTPFIFSNGGGNYDYFKLYFPYDPKNEEAYLEVLKYALQHSVEAGDVIFDRFEDMNTTLSNRNLSKADRADYVSKNINKFIKVKEGIYYNITADEGGNIGLIVSKSSLW